jgi:hypothetical protein
MPADRPSLAIAAATKVRRGVLEHQSGGGNRVMSDPIQTVLRMLAESGLLLKQDKRIPNVVTLLTGESLHTSWWSHPKAHLIFSTLSQLSMHPDVLFTKLLYGKVTLVHRNLWPAFLAVASANERWQLHGLSTSGRRLLAAVQESERRVRCSGKVVKELELRLLVHAEEVHTESGRHELMVESWKVWSRRVGTHAMRSTASARKQLEGAVKAIGASTSALPWPSGSI